MRNDCLYYEVLEEKLHDTYKIPHNTVVNILNFFCNPKHRFHRGNYKTIEDIMKRLGFHLVYESYEWYYPTKRKYADGSTIYQRTIRPRPFWKRS